MTRAASMLVALCIAVISGSGLAYADTPASDITAVLQTSSVFVDPSIEDAATVSAKLTSRLTQDDMLKIVILADSETSSPEVIAENISASLPTTVTVVVAISNQHAVYSTSNWPPQIVADDILARANSVTQNPTDLMLRTIQQIHSWQAANPLPEPLQPGVPDDDSGLSIGSSVSGIVVLLGLVAVGTLVVRRNAGYKEVYGAPRKYRKVLKDISTHKSAYAGTNLGKDLKAICEDSVYFFKKGNQADAALLHKHLQNVVKVLVSYDKVKSHQRYYSNPEALLSMGEESIREFRDVVLGIARKGNMNEVGDFEVNTLIVKDARNSITLPTEK